MKNQKNAKFAGYSGSSKIDLSRSGKSGKGSGRLSPKPAAYAAVFSLNSHTQGLAFASGGENKPMYNPLGGP